MALPFRRNFKNGRQSEQFLNDELITLYESLKYLPHHVEDHQGELPPGAKINGALNMQPSDGVMNYWDTAKSKWTPLFQKKFQIVDQILMETCPPDPVVGQLWLNNGVLCYFDGAKWRPVRSIQVDDSQWSNAAFADFELISPLNAIGQYVVPLDSGTTGKDKYIYNYIDTIVVTDAGVKTYETGRAYRSLQDELEVHLNGILLVHGRDFQEMTASDTVPTERSLECKSFKILISLQAGDVIAYHISRPMYPTGDAPQTEDINEDWRQYFYENEIDYVTNNTVLAGPKWNPESWASPEMEEPSEQVITEEYQSQFPVPNLKYDRVFKDGSYDHSYTQLNSVCFQYPTIDILGKTVSAIHLNPGKLTGITKRLIKVDKLNSTIAVPAYNTEFYGFRNGEYLGSFLIPSQSQDYGDYIAAGDHILLNYHTNQNYDYILAITYDFTWLRADGSMAKNGLADMAGTFYIANLRDPLNVHVNGLKLEEASYDINLKDKTVMLEDNAKHVSVSMWSPYKKQFGYIRETDLSGRGIIRLHEMVHVPLVFVGGTLVHPLYGGLEMDGDIIYVPNSGSVNQMKNMQWCVVDLVSDDYDIQYQQAGHAEETMASYVSSANDRLDGNDMYFNGTLSTTSQNGIYDFVLASGTITGVSGVVIRYDTNKIKPTDGVLLFVDGLLVDEENIVRDAAEGLITVVGGMTEDQEYVLLKDQDGAIYNSANMLPAVGTGYFSDSLVYFNGKLVCNQNCVMTVDTPEQEAINGAVYNEIKYFITNEKTGAGTWKIYDQYHLQWNNLTMAERTNVTKIVGSYENLLTALKINIPYDTDTDDIVIYTFKFANDLSALTEVGVATYYGQDEEDDVPIYAVGSGHYGYQRGMLNVYQNGVKLVEGRDYEEMAQGKLFRLLADTEDHDVIQYMIDPVEHGYEYGHITVRLDNTNAVQANIYTVPEEMDILLYPGRLTVYINGIRIPNTDWTLLSNRTILLKYTDYKAVGSAMNYPEELLADDNYNATKVTHTFPDEILVEIRYDYTRQEKTIFLPEDITDLSIEENELDREILESADEVLFYLNGQFAGLSRNKNNDYRLDRYRGCISFLNADFIEAASVDKMKELFDRDNYIYTAWKQMTGKMAWTPGHNNALTIVWR